MILTYTEKKIIPVRISKGIPRIKTNSKQILDIVRTHKTFLKISWWSKMFAKCFVHSYDTLKKVSRLKTNKYRFFFSIAFQLIITIGNRNGRITRKRKWRYNERMIFSYRKENEDGIKMLFYLIIGRKMKI
jgi:hypothetical protein